MATDQKLGRAVLELVTTDSGFERGIRSAERRAKKLGQTLDGIGSKIQSLGTGLTLALTAPIVGLGVAALKTASDVQEMQNLFRETFEESSDDVERWADTLARSVNRSRFDLQKTAAEFAAFLKPLGVADESIAPMSQALTQLTTDISSFRNIAEEDVFTRLFSGLAGETEAVRRLGIDISQAALEQELLNLGIEGGISAAEQSEKVMARFSLIMRQTSDAQGDAARTAGSFENQTRGLTGTIKEIGVEIGQRFLPLATRLISKLRELGQRFLDLPGNVQSGIVSVVGFIAIIGPAILALGLLTRAVGFAIQGFALLGPALRFAGKTIRALLIAIQAVVVGFTAFFATVPGAIITSLAAIVGGFIIFKDTIIGFAKGLILALVRELVAGINNKVAIPVQETFNSLIDFLPDRFGLVPITVNDVIDNSFKEDFKAVVAEATTNGKREFEGFKSAASAAIDSVKGTFSRLAGAAGAFIPDIKTADLTLGNVGSKFDDLLSQFGGVRAGLSNVGKSAKDAGDEVEDAFDRFGTSISASIEDNLSEALRGIKNFGDAARSILDAVINSLIRAKIAQPLLAAAGLPTFADGGRPQSGRAAVVGERGPELFVPDTSGTIIPNDRLGGMGGGISQEFNFPLAFPPQLEAFVRNIAGPAGRDAATQVIRAQSGRF